MGDELHMRSQATGNLLIRDLAPAFAALGGEASARFIAGNHHFFLNLTMAAASARGWRSAPSTGSSIVSADVAQRHRRWALQLAGLPGRWFTAPAAPVAGPAPARGHTAPTTRRSTSATRR